MNRFFLVRHAETLVTGPRVLRGVASAQDALSERGHQQATACAAEFAARALHDPRVYASTYLRAQQTAAAIATALGVDLHVVDGLQEMDIGAWRGRPYSHLETHTHELLGPGGYLAFPGGESQLDVTRRNRAALERLLARGGTPIIVSHGLAIHALICDLLGVNFVEAWHDERYAHRNTAVTELRREEHGWAAVQVASVGHLHAH